jgi:hypothetical protein
MSVERKEGEQPLARAFHFTNADNLSDIQTGNNLLLFDEKDRLTTNRPGLYPRTTFGDSEYIFCFLNNSYPPQWQAHPDLYKALLSKIGKDNLHLFAFDVYESDNPFVCDFSYALPFFVNGRFGRGGAASQFESYFRYLESIIPLKDYRGGYELPELLIPSPISFDRLNSLPLPPEKT